MQKDEFVTVGGENLTNECHGDTKDATVDAQQRSSILSCVPDCLASTADTVQHKVDGLTSTMGAVPQIAKHGSASA